MDSPCCSRLALVLLSLLALLTPHSVEAVAGYTKLVSAVKKANKFALACEGKDASCLGQAVTVVLNEDVVLGGPLPALNYSAHLIIKGACPGKRNKHRCVIDGQLKYQVFPRVSPIGPPPSLLELDNLIFQKANGGVLANTFSIVIGTNVIFRNNIGGAIIAGGEGPNGNKPPQTYTNCRWENNNGTAITFGGAKYGLSTNGTGLVIKRSVFYKNSGTDIYAGGAITLTGAGTSTFENVQFTGNTAGQSGGAVWADQTTVKFRGVTFTGNTALTGGGGAVYGESSYYYGASLSFCSCKFSGNTAPKNPKADTLDFEAVIPPGNTNKIDVAFCDTPIPPGTVLPAKANGTVSIGSGRRCFRRYC